MILPSVLPALSSWARSHSVTDPVESRSPPLCATSMKLWSGPRVVNSDVSRTTSGWAHKALLRWNLLRSTRAVSLRGPHRRAVVRCRMAPNERSSALLGLRASVRVSTRTALSLAHQLPRGRRDGVLLRSRRKSRVMGGVTSFDGRARVSRIPRSRPGSRLPRLPAPPCAHRPFAPPACVDRLSRPSASPAWVACLGRSPVLRSPPKRRPPSGDDACSIDGARCRVHGASGTAASARGRD